MVSQYQRGRSFEYRIKKDLERRGYFVVRAAQSKGVADLVAIRNLVSEEYAVLSSVLLVQCKLTGQISWAEWNTLFDVARNCGAAPIVASQSKPRSPLIYTKIIDARKPRQVLAEQVGRPFLP